jgi:tetratricopeptide (TPR) repeat protein
MAFALTDVSAQVDKREVRRGNRDFKKENYKEAELEYFRALAKDSLSFAANYNMANTLYRQENYDQALKYMEKIADMAVDSPAAADYYYNLGNIALAKNDYQKAVDAYKQSLLRNPADLEAKENYIYAKEKLKQQQQQQNDQNKDDQNKDDQNKDDQNKDDQNKDDQDKNDKDNQDKNQDKNDQNKDQDKNDKNDQNKDQDKNNNNDQKDGDQDKQPGSEPKISPQAAQQMLQAIQAKEKETQEKVNKEKAALLNSRKKEKNW